MMTDATADVMYTAVNTAKNLAATATAPIIDSAMITAAVTEDHTAMPIARKLGLRTDKADALHLITTAVTTAKTFAATAIARVTNTAMITAAATGDHAVMTITSKRGLCLDKAIIALHLILSAVLPTTQVCYHGFALVNIC